MALRLPKKLSMLWIWNKCSRPTFDVTYYAGKVEGPKGIIKLDDGTDLEYLPAEISLDMSGKASEKLPVHA